MGRRKLITKEFFYSSFLIFILAVIGLPTNISTFNEALELYGGKGNIITGTISGYGSEISSSGGISHYYTVDYDLRDKKLSDRFYTSFGYIKPKNVGDQIELLETYEGGVVINSIEQILFMPSFYLLFNACLLIYGMLWIYLYLQCGYFPLKDGLERLLK
ncbi:hypothetical protein [Tunicatimonas pelagia]|uniref:hypothetical protein n=1 Tax=Tunicatimonas pelagia TaxID=931531 RepID=UPI00266607E1|nr:hypothetical protein [Tunicatimonas pelagia]WKN41121.1 hypothetical protein P0M28_18980 [Tunicatimonas pelagia]